MTDVIKPWGFYRDLQRHDNWVVKLLHVKPRQAISLQEHKERDEVWTVVGGGGYAFYEGEDCPIGEGDTVVIEKNHVHRLTAGPEGITIIEVQHGNCREDDIIRHEDNYGRIS